MALKLSTFVPSSGPAAGPDLLRAGAQMAEEAGFAGFWLGDHVVVPKVINSSYLYSSSSSAPHEIAWDQPFLECLTSLSYVAAVTNRIALGTQVMVLPQRNPVLTAKMVATLDVLSNGRARLGVGVGWMREEFDALAVPFDERAERYTEYVDIIKAAWTSSPVTIMGKFFRLEDIGVLPLPVQKPHPPIIFGGNSVRALRRAARQGDGWVGVGVPRHELPAIIERLGTMVDETGRPHESVKVMVSVPIGVGESSAHPFLEGRTLRGSADEILTGLKWYEQQGVDEVCVYPFLRDIFGDRDAILARVQELSEILSPILRQQ